MTGITKLAAIAVALISAAILVTRSKPATPTFTLHPGARESSTNAAHASDFLPAIADAPSVHAPSLTETEDGSLFCVWWGGSREGGPDVRIFLSKREANGWSQPWAIMSRDQAMRELLRPIRRIGNAVICSRGSELIIIFVTTTIGGWSTSALNIIRSNDAGQTWSRAERLFISPVLNISELARSQPVPTSNGFAVPIYHELAGKFPEILWLEGDTYRKTKPFGGRTAFQPALTAVTPTRALMALRDPNRRNLYTSWTTDGGKTFGPPTRDELPNPNAAVEVIALPGNRVFLAHNNSNDRSNLSLSLSNDDGITWRVIKTIENDPTAEFAYPALHLGRDGQIHLAYTWKRERIRYHTFNQAWLDQ